MTAKRPTIQMGQRPNIPLAQRLHNDTNSAALYLIKNSTQQVGRISFVFRAGTSYQSVPFSASAVVNMLAEGTERFSGREVAERLDFLGSYYEATIDRDYAVLTFCFLKRFAAETLEIAEQVVLHPAFATRETSVYCRKRKEQLDVQRSKPDHLSRELFGRTLFGADHPYGITSPSEEYDRLTPNVLREFYAKHYVAKGCFAVMCGDIDQAEVDAAQAILSQLPEGCDIVRHIPAPEPQPFAHQRVESAVQASLKVGVPLFNRSHPDFIPMQVVSTALGGYFGSRLMQNLRERHGLTYGAYAATINFDRSGYFVCSAEVAGEHAEFALEQMYAELEQIASKPMGARELRMVKKSIFGDVMRIFDGPFGVADVTIENIQNHTDNSYTARFLEQVERISAAELRDVAARNLKKCTLTTTIVSK